MNKKFRTNIDNRSVKNLSDSEIASFKIDNVCDMDKFAKMKDIREFAAELDEEWIEYQSTRIDCDNAWYEDDIMIEFFQDGAERAGLEGWENDYLFWHLGY